MALDLSGVINVLQDTLRVADEYSSHDPKLSAELSLRAYEICREFDIDVASLEQVKETAPQTRVEKIASIAVPDEPLVQDQARKHPIVVEDHDRLPHILDLQRTLADAPSGEGGRQSDPEPRSIWLRWRVFNLLIRPQPI